MILSVEDEVFCHCADHDPVFSVDLSRMAEICPRCKKPIENGAAKLPRREKEEVEIQEDVDG